ncbi:MAG: LuxR C-terminal-related transcriptional regulator, partial [Chloroflexota bacterium]|nr:LuxR C-terminal-related transcriptional regulator [Chloroflexota bacterium]
MAEYGEPLTDREKEILLLVSTGITNREVAHHLSISVNTVKVHLRNVYTKLGAESRTEATMMAVREGWVAVPETAAVKGAEGESAPPQTPPVAPEPPLPWTKRAALTGALLLVAASVAVTRPRSGTEASAGAGLPPDQSSEQAPPPATETADSSWRELAQMPTRRAYLALAAAGGRIFAIGGQTLDGVTDAVEIYDPAADIWTRGSDKPTPATYVSASVLGTDVYAPGGCDAEGTPTHVVEVYDTLTDSWREAGPLPEPRCAYALAAQGEKLYLFGGWDGG